MSCMRKLYYLITNSTNRATTTTTTTNWSRREPVIGRGPYRFIFAPKNFNCRTKEEKKPFINSHSNPSQCFDCSHSRSRSQQWTDSQTIRDGRKKHSAGKENNSQRQHKWIRVKNRKQKERNSESREMRPQIRLADRRFYGDRLKMFQTILIVLQKSLHYNDNCLSICVSKYTARRHVCVRWRTHLVSRA